MSIKPYWKDGRKFFEVFEKTTDITGRQHAKRKRAITSEREARKVQFEFQKQFELLRGRNPSWTWAEWLSECVRRLSLTHTQGTVQNYEGRLNKWIPKGWQERELTQFGRNDLHELVFEVFGSEMSDQSRRAILKLIRRVFQMAIEEGLLTKNPADGIVVKVEERRKSVLTATETTLLLKAAKENEHRFYYVWAFALFTGMRSGEMYALKWKSIDLESGTIAVVEQWTSKDGFRAPKCMRSRVVPICSSLKSLLLELRVYKSSELDFVLPRLKEWENGEQASVIREFCRQLGIREIKFHDLRATFITNMLSQGVPLVKVMAIVGHRKMATTDEYLRLAGVEIKGATEKLGYELPCSGEAQVIPLRPLHSHN